tara:strand:- start:270 stop:1073 length:804 start_codon:yes stop_codon:yes gene_type:complete
MQNYKKCYENVWILSGTSDGPPLAEMLLKRNYSVFVSVVSYKASTVYLKDPSLHIFTGRLNEVSQFKDFIIFNKIDYVIDATHPFAKKVSENLLKACNEVSKSIFRFERNYDKHIDKNRFAYISELEGINPSLVNNKNLLLAIGSRFLQSTAQYYINSGANVFTRIIATPESISKAFSSGIRNSNIAILNPSKNLDNSIENYLCEYWKIDFVLCRDSGGYSQKIWEKISLNNKVKLFLLKRPKSQLNTFVYSNYDLLVEELSNSPIK